MLQLNANRKISGVLRGFDAFMNIVLDETIEENTAERKNCGMVVPLFDRDLCRDNRSYLFVCR